MNNMASKPTKFCKIIDQEQADDLRLPKKFASKCSNKLPKNEVYLKVPDGLTLSWPVEVTYSPSKNEVWFRKGWSAFRDHYSIGPGYYLEFTYNGVAKFDVIIFDITGSEIKYYRLPYYVAASCPSPDDSQRFYKIIVEPECDRLRLPLAFVERYGPTLPDSVFIHVPGSWSKWRVDLVRSNDGEIYMEGRWKLFKEFYDIYPGHSLVFEFLPQHKSIDVSIYDGDGTATVKDFRFNELDDIHVEGYDSEEDSSLFLEEKHGEPKGKEKLIVEYYQQEENNGTSVGISENGSMNGESNDSGDDSLDCSIRESAQTVKLGSGYDSDSDEDDSSVFLEEIHGRARGKEKVCVEDYYQDDNRTTIGIVEHCSITPGTKRKRLEESDGSGEDLVDCSVGKSARSLKHSSGNTFTKWKFIEELQPYNAYRLCFPTEFTRSTKITPGMEVILRNVEGKEWKVRVTAKYERGQHCLSSGWHKYLVDNFVVIGSTMEFKFVRSSDHTIEARVVKVGPNPEELFKHVKREGGGYVVKIPKLRWAKQLKEWNRYKLTIPSHLSNVLEVASNGEVKLQDQKGRKWPVKTQWYAPRDNYILSTGWTDFLVGNKVYIGSTILLEIIPGTNNVIEVQILEKGPGRVRFVKGPRTT